MVLSKVQSRTNNLNPFQLPVSRQPQSSPEFPKRLVQTWSVTGMASPNTWLLQKVFQKNKKLLLSFVCLFCFVLFCFVCLFVFFLCFLLLFNCYIQRSHQNNYSMLQPRSQEMLNPKPPWEAWQVPRDRIVLALHMYVSWIANTLRSVDHTNNHHRSMLVTFLNYRKGMFFCITIFLFW